MARITSTRNTTFNYYLEDDTLKSIATSISANNRQRNITLLEYNDAVKLTGKQINDDAAKNTTYKALINNDKASPINTGIPEYEADDTFLVYGSPEKWVFDNRQQFNNCGVVSCMNILVMSAKMTINNQNNDEKQFTFRMWQEGLCADLTPNYVSDPEEDYGDGVFNYVDGGTSLSSIKMILNKYNINAEVWSTDPDEANDHEAALSLDSLADIIKTGGAAIIAVDSQMLCFGESEDPSFNHAILVTGVVYDESNELRGFYIHDSGVWMTRYISKEELKEVAYYDVDDDYKSEGFFCTVVPDAYKNSANNTNAIGNNYVNIIEGNSGNNTIDGKGGNDTLYGYGGDDLIYGGEGHDTIYGGEGNDTINGGNGNDKLYGENGNDTISGGNGNDTIYSGDGDDIVYGNNGNDTIYGGNGIDTIYGGNHNDLIDGGDGDDFLYGDAGHDTIYGGNGIDIIYGGNNNDTLYGDAGDDTIYGGNHNDTIYGGDGSDTLYGDNGHDKIYGGDGIDTIYGGNNNDLIDGADGNDFLYGDNGNDTIYGGNGIDTIDGGAGNDSIYGGTGNDIIECGAGNDNVYFDSTSGIDTVTSLSGSVNFIFDNIVANNITYELNDNALELGYDDGNYINYTDFYDTENNKCQIAYITDKNSLGKSTKYRFFATNAENTIKVANSKGNNVLYSVGDNNNTIVTSKYADIVFMQGGNDVISYTGGKDFYFSTDGDDSYNVNLFNKNTNLTINDTSSSPDNDLLNINANRTAVGLFFDVSAEGTANDNNNLILFNNTVIKNLAGFNNIISDKANGIVTLSDYFESGSNFSQGDGYIETITAKNGRVFSQLDVDSAISSIVEQVSAWLDGTEYTSAFDAIQQNAEGVNDLINIYRTTVVNVDTSIV